MLQERAAAGHPILFALFGAGFMGRGILHQLRYHQGLRCPAVCARDPEKALVALKGMGYEEARVVNSSQSLDSLIASGGIGITSDPDVVCGSERIEGVLDATGAVDYGAGIVSRALEAGKHSVVLNAELDGTIGPLLKEKADQAGVVYTGCDGDQPAVEMNLYRFVRTLGLEPLVCGNIKGLHDPHRTPTTQQAFAEKWGQSATMVTSFADGTKVSFEQAVVANATGMSVAKRGMGGFKHEGHVDDLVSHYDPDELRRLGGIVDYVVGASPSPGVFVLAAARDETQAHFLHLGKLGQGPLYSFYVPYHLLVLEAPLTVARAVAFGDAAIAPAGGPRVEVVAVAKRDLAAGETIDGLGGYMTYGTCENYGPARTEGLLPIGLAEGARLRRGIGRDQLLHIDDVVYPTGTFVHSLRAEQDAMFSES